MGENGKFVMIDGRLVWVPDFSKQPINNDAAIDFILKEEGFLEKPKDIGDGKITIGSGLTDPKWIELYKARGNKWSDEDNRMAVAEEVQKRREWNEENVPNWERLSPSAQNALLSYRYNYNYTRDNSPKLFKALEDFNLFEAAKQMDASSGNSKFTKGLGDRREREQNQFLSDYNQEPSIFNTEPEVPVSTKVTTPYSTQLEKTKRVPAGPYKDEYVVTESEKRRQQLRKAFKAKQDYNRIMEATNLQNTVTPQFTSTSSLFAKGGLLEPKDAWDKLSIPEKADIIKVGVKHGIFDLQELRKKYNEFKEGGSMASDASSETMNEIPSDYTPLVSNKYQPIADALKSSNTGFNVDDYAYRVKKLHPEITREQVQSVYNSTPYIGSDKVYGTQEGGFRVGDETGYGRRVTLYPNAYTKNTGTKVTTSNANDTMGGTFAHETNHLYTDVLLGGSNDTEKDLLFDAYRPGFVVQDPKFNGDFSEERAINAQIRNRISRENGNVIGADLDKAIDDTPDDVLMEMLFDPNNGYINQSGKKHMQDKNGNWNRTDAVRKALKDVAFNSYDNLIDSNIAVLGGPLVDAANYRDENIYGLGDWLKKGLSWLKNSAQVAAIADNPSVMTAAGHRITREGKAVQDRQNSKDVKQLRQNLANFGEGALGAMTATGDVEAAYNVLRHPVQTARVVKTGITKAKKSISNNLSKLITRDKRALNEQGLGLSIGKANETQKYAELGRKDFLEDIASDWYRKRWENATSLSAEDLDRVIGEIKTSAENVPFDYAKTAEQLSDKDGFVTWGTSSPRPKLEYTSLDGRPVTDYNTGLDVHIASDRGSKARNTSYHELLHYTTNNAKGIYTQYATPIHNGIFEPIGLDYGDNILIPRGKTWQHFIAEQNETLLPKMDSIYKKVIDNPSEVENTLIQMGRTPEEAKQQVQILRNEIQDLDDIQEVRAHMKTWFKSDVMPYLKNPNDASEIESVLKNIPDILENRPDKVRRVMEVVRPGSLSDYSKYLAESLSVLPFIYNKSNNK